MVLELVAFELGADESAAVVRFVAGGVVEVLGVALEARSARVDDVDAQLQALVACLVVSR